MLSCCSVGHARRPQGFARTKTARRENARAQPAAYRPAVNSDSWRMPFPGRFAFQGQPWTSEARREFSLLTSQQIVRAMNESEFTTIIPKGFGGPGCA
jgi:hypothetical protein